MNKNLFVLGSACDTCGNLLQQLGKLTVRSFIQFKIIEHILAVCIVCDKLHTIERIWETCQKKFEETEVQDDLQMMI